MGVNNSLLKSIQTIVDKEVESASFDKTRQGQVLTNNNDGTYTIRLDGVLYNNIPSYPKVASIDIGSVVKISIPSNQPSQMYIITPKGGGGSGNHLEITQEDYDDLPTDKKQGDTVFFVTESEPEYLIMSDSVPIGAIQSYGGNVAPSGWLICDGRAISRAEYSELFYVIGTTYGSGDGSTTFNVPDLKGRVITGVGTCDGVTYALGDKKSAGVPNITGYITGGDMAVGSYNWSASGALYTAGSYKAMKIARDNNDANVGPKYSNIAIDASRSSTKYGNSSTVQPNTTVANYIIKAKQPPTENVIKGLDTQGVLIDAFYPVGSYYETSDISFDPNISWGGIWTREIVTNDNEFEELTLTPSSGITIGGANGMYRIGNVIYVFVNFYGSTTTVFTGLPKPKIPAQATSRRLAIPTSTAGTQSRFLLDANGTLVWDGTGNDNWQNGAFSYVTDDFILPTSYRWHRTA